jgi:hypothetical protein
MRNTALRVIASPNHRVSLHTMQIDGPLRTSGTAPHVEQGLRSHPRPESVKRIFDASVRSAGDNYRLPADYDAVHGPNSNTGAHDIIENAGGTLPNIPRAPNYIWP